MLRLERDELAIELQLSFLATSGSFLGTCLMTKFFASRSFDKECFLVKIAVLGTEAFDSSWTVSYNKC